MTYKNLKQNLDLFGKFFLLQFLLFCYGFVKFCKMTLIIQQVCFRVIWLIFLVSLKKQKFRNARIFRRGLLFSCIIVIFYILIFAPYSFAYASFFEFGTSSVLRSAQIGDTIFVPVFVEPSGGSISIVGADIDFSKELLWAKSFELSEKWLQVSDGDYNFIDNREGMLRKTAGIAEEAHGSGLTY